MDGPTHGAPSPKDGGAPGDRPRVEIRLLGPLAATLDGTPLDLGAPKQRAVLAVLALEVGRVVSADRLVELLWGDDAPRATATLQTYVSNLRRILEPDRRPRDPAAVIVTEPPGYRLALPADCTDVGHMTELVAAGRRLHRAGDTRGALAAFERALAAWTGDLLPELADEPFVLAAAERLRRLHLAAVTLSSETHLESGDHLAALATLEAAVDTHPLDEHLHALLALALYRCGRQADALRTIDRLRRALADEAGLEPGPELRSLESDLLANAPTLDWRPTSTDPAAAPAPQTAPPAPPGTPVEPSDDRRPIVGRETELARLVQALDRAVAGTGSAVVVIGEPGIGKTRILEELAEIARRRGVPVGWARCPESGAIPPFWPVTEVSSQLFAAGAIDATLTPPLDVLGSDDATSPQTLFELYQLVATAMRNASMPTLVVVDDLQWADADSLRMLGHVAAGLPATSLLLCVATRPLTDDSSPALIDGLDALARSATSQHLQLDGLSVDDVAQWLRARSDTEVSRKVADLVHERTSGHPLFVKELSELLAAEGQLTEAGLVEAGRAIPPGVQFVVRRRVTRLPQATQQLLTVAAVLGRTFDLEAVAELSGLDPGDALDALDPALEAALVVSGSDGSFRFSHAVVAEALEAEVNHSRRARLHARAAEILATRPEVGPEVVAHHAIEGALAGTGELAFRASAEAARAAESRLGFEDAATHWEHAVQALTRFRGAGRGARIDALCNLSSALFRIDRVTEASQAAVEALELAEVEGDLDAMARAGALVGHPHVWPHHAYGDVDRRVASALRRTAEALGPDRVRDRARVLGALALEVTYGPDEEWEAVAAEARQAARESGDPDVLARVLLNTSGDMPPSQIDRRRADALEVIDLVDQHHLHPELELIARFNVALTDNEVGEIDDAAVQVARCTQIGERLGGSGAMAQLLWFDAQLQLARCRYDQALELGRTAEEMYRRTRAHDTELIAMVLEVSIVADRGGFAAFVDRFRAAAGESPAYAGGTGQILAWLALENGWPDLARELADQIGPAARLPDDYTTLGFGCAALQLRAALGHTDDVASLMTQLEPYAGRWSGMGSGPAVMGLVDHSLALGAEHLGRLAEARRHNAAAVAGHERLRTPAWLARSLIHQARFLLTHGEPAERADALAALDRAGALAAEHGLEPVAHQAREVRTLL